MDELELSETGPIEIVSLDTDWIELPVEAMAYPDPIRASDVRHYYENVSQTRRTERQEIILGSAAGGAAIMVLFLMGVAIVAAFM